MPRPTPWLDMATIPANRQAPLSQAEAFAAFNPQAHMGPHQWQAQPDLPMSAVPYAPGPVGPPASLPASQIPYAIGRGPEASNLAGPPAPETGAGGFAGGGGGAGAPPSFSGGSSGQGGGYAALLRELKEKGDFLAGQQRDAANAQKMNMAQLYQPLDYDLSPLAALADQWSGSNLARSYNAPESVQERRGAIDRGLAGVRQAELGATETELAALRGLASGTFDLEKYQADQAYRNTQVGLEREKLGLEREKVGIERTKASRPAGPMRIGRLPAKAVSDYTDFQGAVSMAENLGGLIKRNSRLMGPAASKEAWNPWATEHRKLQSEFDLVRQKIGKMVEGGVLRKEDESKYEKILPTMGDLPDVAASKARKFEVMLKADLARYMANFGKAGYDVSGFADETAEYQGAAQGLKPTFDSEDEAALAWAMANPENPAAMEILQLHEGGH